MLNKAIAPNFLFNDLKNLNFAKKLFFLRKDTHSYTLNFLITALCPSLLFLKSFSVFISCFSSVWRKFYFLKTERIFYSNLNSYNFYCLPVKTLFYKKKSYNHSFFLKQLAVTSLVSKNNANPLFKRNLCLLNFFFIKKNFMYLFYFHSFSNLSRVLLPSFFSCQTSSLIQYSDSDILNRKSGKHVNLFILNDKIF